MNRRLYLNRSLFLVPGILILASCFLLPFAAAKPEEVVLKNEKQKARENAARQMVQGIQLSRIQDPEARKAIQAILKYLELPYNQ